VWRRGGVFFLYPRLKRVEKTREVPPRVPLLQSIVGDCSSLTAVKEMALQNTCAARPA